MHTHHTSQPQLAQNLVDGCQLIGITQLAERLNRAAATVRTQVTREPQKLPPRFLMPGSNQVAWMLSVVIEWMVQQQSSSLFPSASLKTTGGRRRGAPTSAEKMAAAKAGMSVTEFRAEKEQGRA